MVGVSMRIALAGWLAFPALVAAASESPSKEEAKALKKSCETGDATACASMADYHLGKRDLEKAASFSERACSGGNNPSCRQAADLFNMLKFSGMGKGAAESKVFSVDSTGCARGYMPSCAHLGHGYIYGVGVSVDYAKAFEYLDRACKAEDGDGCASLAYLYAQGHGPTPQDGSPKPTERELYEKACGFGSAGGCRNLGAIAYFAKEYAKAAQAYQRACDISQETDCTDAKEMAAKEAAAAAQR